MDSERVVVKHYWIGRRLVGALVMLLGMAVLLGSVYSSICFSVPVFDVALAFSGAVMICMGFAVNSVVVRRRISKRGYFYW